MSQSLLYHAFGVREGYEYRSTKYVEGRVEFHLRVEKKLMVCPGCGSTKIHRRGGRTRRIRSVPIGLKETVLVVEGAAMLLPGLPEELRGLPPLPEPTSDTAYPWLDSFAD